MDEKSYFAGFVFGIHVAGVGQERMSHEDLIAVLKQIRDGEITLTPSAEEIASQMERETGKKLPDELLENLREHTTGKGRSKARQSEIENAARILDMIDTSQR